MSYARFSETSDVYIYWDVGGYVCCCGCKLDPDWKILTFEEAIVHLVNHVQRGHKVPHETFWEILAEIRQGKEPSETGKAALLEKDLNCPPH